MAQLLSIAPVVTGTRLRGGSSRGLLPSGRAAARIGRIVQADRGRRATSSISTLDWLPTERDRLTVLRPKRQAEMKPRACRRLRSVHAWTRQGAPIPFVRQSL